MGCALWLTKNLENSVQWRAEVKTKANIATQSPGKEEIKNTIKPVEGKVIYMQAFQINKYFSHVDQCDF